MSIISRILTTALGLFLISSGVAKFMGGHVFQYIEYRSGLDVFYPYVNHATGVAEVLAGGFILFRTTRLVGSAAAVGIMVGAVGFHLSPWLGISMPVGLTEGAAAPVDRRRFLHHDVAGEFRARRRGRCMVDQDPPRRTAGTSRPLAQGDQRPRPEPVAV